MVFFLVAAGAVAGISIGALLFGLILGFVGASFYFKEQIKKNPPRFSEEDIRKLWSQTGRKLSETQLKKIMNELQPKN